VLVSGDTYCNLMSEASQPSEAVARRLLRVDWLMW